ncbi:antirepressor protein Cro [Xenorhabdus beddingii]|uniref:Antirepressor protein Cro n=1 Tax=Xenorhabdus beddingii TaxID=40578 RepID=A0A1Y2SE35_9GAMM|nr:YdaS family helix-turn-helix protein [Xenorhabdus beddingii]OTA16536.1 antirepressor protein Cro [Xenorhabdus beddingii]
MDKLRIFLNALTVEERRSFAAKCKTTVGYLRNAISTKKKLGASLCVLIEKNSNGLVTRKDLHSDWVKTWPELAA